MTDLIYDVVLSDRFGENFGDLGEYVLQEVKWGVNVFPTCKVMIPESNDRVADIVLWKHELRARINGKTRFVGEIHQCDMDEKLNYTFTADGLLEIFKHRYLWDNGALVFDWPNPTEQFDIAWGLISYGQQVPSWWNADSVLSSNYNNPRDLRIVRGPGSVNGFGGSASGQKWPMRYLRFDGKSIYQYLQDLRADILLDGMDFSIDYDDASGERQFNMYFPFKMQDFSGYRYELGANMRGLKLTESTADAGTDIFYKGGSVGTVQIFGEYVDHNATAYFGDHQLLISSQYTDKAYLNRLAERTSRQKRQPVISPSFDISVSDDIVATHEEGDLINVVIKTKRYNIGAIYRIMEMTWKPPSKVCTLGVVPWTNFYPDLLGDFVIPT